MLAHIFRDKINKENSTLLHALQVVRISVKYLTISDSNSQLENHCILIFTSQDGQAFDDRSSDP